VSTGPRQLENVPIGFLHQIAPGETLSQIGRHYSVEASAIAVSNRIADAANIQAGEILWIPKGMKPSHSGVYDPSVLALIDHLIAPQERQRAWQTITVHHSATESGNGMRFHRHHESRQMKGLFYHFVIGNGEGFPDGGIEIGWRWGAQAEANRPLDIQICVVGDFTRQKMTPAQLTTLTQLVSILSSRYNIPVNGIRRHKDIPGQTTACPGARFPFHQLLSSLTEVAI